MQTQAIDFHPPAEEAAAFLLPVKSSLFANRADRFATLANEHSLSDWLKFLGQITAAQHDALKALATLPLPDAATLEQARTHGMPPLNPAERPAVWRDILLSNKEELLAQSKVFQHNLQALELMISSGNGEALEGLLEQASLTRANWSMAKHQK